MSATDRDISLAEALMQSAGIKCNARIWANAIAAYREELTAPLNARIAELEGAGEELWPFLVEDLSEYTTFAYEKAIKSMEKALAGKGAGE